MVAVFHIKENFQKDKEVETMAVIYATLIVKGKKTFDQVPERLQAQVREILVDLEVPELAE